MSARDPLAICETKFAPADLTGVEADGAFSGYASLFGEVDMSRDAVMPGAFSASLKRRGTVGVKMLFQHDPSEPIGIWREVREDMRGLYVRGQLMREVARAREVLALMRAGALDGLSIGYRTVRSRIEPKGRVRQLLEVDLWEISVVTFPMLAGARVSAVKTDAVRRADAARRARFGQVEARLASALREAAGRMKNEQI